MKALATFIYMMVTLAFGLWMICQLYDSKELHGIKSDIENYHFQVNRMIDKLED